MDTNTTTANPISFTGTVTIKATKADIITRLLAEGKITVEECVTLLMNDNQPYIYVPHSPPSPMPWYPSYPIIY